MVYQCAQEAVLVLAECSVFFMTPQLQITCYIARYYVKK